MSPVDAPHLRSGVAEACSQLDFDCRDIHCTLPDVAFYVTTYKRTEQLKSALPINLMYTWNFRLDIAWILMDLNDDPAERRELEQFLIQNCRASLETKQLRVYRKSQEWNGWHASIAKNAAALAAIHEFGNSIVLVNVDGDNFTPPDFCKDILKLSDGPMAFHGDKLPDLCGAFYRHPHCSSTTGRIACPATAFKAIGGYSEDLGPYGYEDIILMRCLGQIGETVRREGTFIGGALRNSMHTGAKTHHEAPCNYCVNVLHHIQRLAPGSSVIVSSSSYVIVSLPAAPLPSQCVPPP